MVVIDDNEEEMEVSPTTQEEIDETPGQEVEEWLQHIEDYEPTVPDALTLSYLNNAGFDSVDSRIVRLISVSAQKMIAGIANDALVHCKTRTSNNQHSHSSSHGGNKDKKSSKDKKYTLAIEDLTPALADHGITVRKPQYFV